MKKAALSLALLGLFVYGMGLSAFVPSLQALRNTQWDISLFWVLNIKKLTSLLWLLPIGLGFFGWVRWLRLSLLGPLHKPMVYPVGFALVVSLFSLYCFVLGVNEILYPALVSLFFLVALIPGIAQFHEWHRELKLKPPSFETRLLIAVVVLIWGSEYLSAPIIWDAVLDHFRFAEEVARLHQLPFHWTNHTGDMPKFIEVIWAGFWSLGGESLAKLTSGISALMMSYLIWVMTKEVGASNKTGQWIFWTCPFFLGIFAWGYVEGFLAFYEVLGVYCLWQFLEKPKVRLWLYLCAFFLGTAFSIKYTAILAIVACDAFLIYQGFRKKKWSLNRWTMALVFILPILHWVFRNELANGNPIYPLATSIFGGPHGYNTHLESMLWEDTGRPAGLNFYEWLTLLWRSFFTINNNVAASWSPLVLMSLPWWGKIFKNRFLKFCLVFTALFFLGWLLFCTSLRHASGGAVVLVLLAAAAWKVAFKEDPVWAKPVFVLGVVISLWLCVSAQLNNTAPYASALGLEDPLKRLARNYSFNLDSYAAYRDIENSSDPRDKVVALGVFQTYPLQRTSFVDFYWKKPILLQWASECQTAEELALKFKKEGALFVLYQREEAIHSFGRNKDYKLEGMSEKEYLRFWQCFMDPVSEYENTFVYRLREVATGRPMALHEVPGLQEPGFFAIQKADFNGDKKKAYELAKDWTEKYPLVAEGWRQRAQVAQGISAQDAYSCAKRANDMGLQDISLCSILSKGLTAEKRTDQVNVWQNLADYRGSAEEAKVEGALVYYRKF